MNSREKILLFLFMILGAGFYIFLQYIIYVENHRPALICKPCTEAQEADRQIYLKLSRATKKYCSANWFDGSEVCQHLETECYNYCIKTTEKNCRVECESRI